MSPPRRGVNFTDWKSDLGSGGNREFAKSPLADEISLTDSRRFLIPTRVPHGITFGSLSSRRPFIRPGSCLVSLLSSPRDPGPARKKMNEPKKIDGLMRSASGRERLVKLACFEFVPPRDRPEALRSILSPLSFFARFTLFCVKSCYVLWYWLHHFRLRFYFFAKRVNVLFHVAYGHRWTIN